MKNEKANRNEEGERRPEREYMRQDKKNQRGTKNLRKRKHKYIIYKQMKIEEQTRRASRREKGKNNTKESD